MPQSQICGLNIRDHIDTSSYHPHRRIRTKSRAHNIISQKNRTDKQRIVFITYYPNYVNN